jgi:hypothetical protein
MKLYNPNKTILKIILMIPLLSVKQIRGVNLKKNNWCLPAKHPFLINLSQYDLFE